MGKTVSARELLAVGRRNPASVGTVRPSNGEGEDSATRQLDDESLQPLVTESAKGQDVEATSRLVPRPVTYQRTTVFLTPAQRAWLKQTAKTLPVEGLSASDVVRLALNRLHEDIEGGLALVEALTTQAHIEAATLTGRRNRGLPPRAARTAESNN